jgi:sugar transferase (PEP-CTERM system associated)
MPPGSVRPRVAAADVVDVVGELGVLILAFLTAVGIRFGASAFTGLEPLWPRALLACLLLLAALRYGNLFEDTGLDGRMNTLARTLRATLLGAVLLAFMEMLLGDRHLGRGVHALFLGLAFAGILGWRLARREIRDRGAASRVLILGTGQSAREVAYELLRRGGVEVVGFLGQRSEVGRVLVNPSVVGTIEELTTVAAQRRASAVVVALDDGRGRTPTEELLRLRLAGVEIHEVTSFLEALTGRIALENLRPSWVVFSKGFDRTRGFLFTKRVIDVAASAALLVVSAPLLALLAILIPLDSPGPVLYRQRRVGFRGKPFDLLKLRTMAVDAEAGGPVWASDGKDPRVSRLGRFLRLTRLDELPQLLNVLRGEMSFVGPRPERPHFVEQLRTVIPYYDARHEVKPGITGWAQVKFGYGSSLEDAERKLEYDLYYVKHMSWVFETGILLYTAKVVLSGKGAR